jgi:putative ATPase
MAKGEAPLFEAQGLSEEPLAARMRPRNLDEFIGQDEIVGPGRLLRRAIQKDQLSSLIFSGPPGTGKTTLARVIANSTSSRFVTLNAVLAGIAEIRAAVEEAKKDRDLYGRRTILFVDEVHRWNKAQQDALLPWVENGTIVLIGATTENPFFEVNRALVSRSRVFQLKALEEADLAKVAEAACRDKERGYGRYDVRFEEGALEHLVKTSDGDARSLLNALELAVETSAGSWPPAEGTKIEVSLAAAEESIQRRAVLYDKDGDYHYDAASAFIKSIRGSDPDAALYWLARMIYSGEDPRFAFRRMLISASEDIGLADPAALNVVASAAAAFDRVGMPEGQFHLAEAALYLATAPKSNSTMGFFDALKAVEAESAEVPDHLKDASRDKHGFGHGEGYLYPHAYRDHWVAQEYLPQSLRGRIFYEPASLGVEGERRALVLERREAQLAALAESLPDEKAGDSGAVWSERGDARASWSYRAEAEAPERLAILRKALFDAAAPARNARILVLDARGGYLLWEALRRAREGTVVALVRSARERELIENYASTLAELERPILIEGQPEKLDKAAVEAGAGFSEFDLVLGRDLLKGSAEPETLLARLSREFPGARFASMESLAREGGRLSALPLQSGLGEELASRFAAFEEEFYGAGGPSELGLCARDLEAAVAASPLRERSVERVVETYRRRLGKEEVATWFAPASAYGSRAAAAFKPAELERIRAAVLGAATSGLEWPLAALLIKGKL